VATVVAGLLLTGGQSRRLGTDKALVRREGETLAARGGRVLSAVCTPVLEVGTGASGLPAVREEPSGAGPLVALVAGVAALRDRGFDHGVLLLAVDLPFVEPRLLEFLAATEPGEGIVVPLAGGRRQPLCAHYSPAALRRAGVLVGEGGRALKVLLGAVPVYEIDEPVWQKFAPPRALDDVDTPEDLARSGLTVDHDTSMRSQGPV
jgi:molybdopterin-guanine dinucleotide biosynthesis protein A